MDPPAVERVQSEHNGELQQFLSCFEAMRPHYARWRLALLCADELSNANARGKQRKQLT